MNQPVTHLTALEAPETALSLPRGTLRQGIFQVAFGDDFVLQAARIIIENNDTRKFFTQAEIIAWAGWEYGFGRGKDYFLA